MKQLIATGPSTLRMDDVPTPEILPGHALCRVAYVGLCGVDLSLWKGYSTYIQQGLKAYPFVLGHEWSGTCVGVAADVDSHLVNRKVAGHNFIVCGICPPCRSNKQENCTNRSEMGVLGAYPGALSEYVVVPASVLTPLPESMSLRRAALLEPSATAMHALDRVGVSAPDRVLIVGSGTVGLCALLLTRALGATVTVAGVDQGSLSLARTLGADHVVSVAEIPADGFDVVIEASGAPNAVQQIPAAVAPGGRVALVGVPNSPVDALMVSSFVMKNVSIEAVYSGIHHWEALVSLVHRANIDLEALIGTVYPFNQFDVAFDSLSSPSKAEPKTLLRVGVDVDDE